MPRYTGAHLLWLVGRVLFGLLLLVPTVFPVCMIGIRQTVQGLKSIGPELAIGEGWATSGMWLVIIYMLALPTFATYVIISAILKYRHSMACEKQRCTCEEDSGRSL